MQSEWFETLLARLSPDRETAGRLYESLRRRLELFFNKHRCNPAEEQADNALDTLARRLFEGEEVLPENLSRYALGIARFQLLEYWRSPERKRAPLENLERIDAASSRDSDERERRHDCLDDCLQRLPAADRRLVQAYYADDWRAQVDGRKRLAEQLGIAPVTLRSRAFRIRQQLEDCVRECLDRSQK